MASRRLGTRLNHPLATLARLELAVAPAWTASGYTPGEFAVNEAGAAT